MNNGHYLYQHSLLSSKDLVKGGYILHFLGATADPNDDYLRCQSIDERLGRIHQPCFDEDYTPKYYNWYGLHFPLLHIKPPSGDLLFDNLSTDERSLTNLAEKHLLADMLFEQFVYSKTGHFKSEIAELGIVLLNELINEYNIAGFALDL